ncbi:uncharacterized protein RCH25_025673 [Pelodytes ibericus]
MVLHLTSLNHRKKYLQMYHREISLCGGLFVKRSDHTRKMRELAAEVERMHGRQRIRAAYGPNTRSDGSSVSHVVSSVLCKDSNGQAAFQENEDFVDYLKMFEIKDDADATFIQKIIKNCTNALLRFREEQANKETRSEYAIGHSTAHSSTIPSTPSTTGKPLSTSSAIAPKPSSSSVAPVTYPIQNDATAFFFSSIKDMDSSEVISVFKKVAATNPAFRGIDIPNLMAYLRDNGKLKQT